MPTKVTTAARGVVYDESLRRYFNHIFMTMCFGLLVTASVSEYIANTGLMQTLFHAEAHGKPQMSEYWIGAVVLQFVLLFMIPSPKSTNSTSVVSGLGLFGLFAALWGVILAPVVFSYTAASLARAFFISAGTFGGAALWGYTTKTDMSKFSGFLIMGLIGLIIAMLVNFALASPMIDFVVSVAGIGIFIGLTAWDMQAFRTMYDQAGGASFGLVVNAALALYLDFINLFIFFLRFVGVRKD